MRASQWFLTTLRENPGDAEIISHQYMLRAGLIRKLGSGLYTWLPLGLLVLRKIEAIVRDEMNKVPALEVLMPSIQPAELWEETGRWKTFGGQLLKMQDNNNREYCYGPTHEEVITDIMRSELRSYKQLPITFYQIQTKFRDEIRPRFGVMRAREFIMKDAYSFHLTKESLQQTYDAMYKAYSRIFERLGLRYRAVEADTGAIGGSASHEFQVLAESGEDIIFFSTESTYAANIEQATSLIPIPCNAISAIPRAMIDTPSQKTIEEVAQFLNIEPHSILKTLIVEGYDSLVALVLCGDDELNEVKATKHPLVKSPLTFASEEKVQSLLGVDFGSIGPIDLPMPIIADHYALALSEFVCGANIEGKHYINGNWSRDVSAKAAYDLRNVKIGDQSPDGRGHLTCCRGIEVGHVFQLGDKYAQAMKASVLDENGALKTMMMGCYGIGVSRLVAAAIEQYHDDKGIIWPLALAPFTVVIIPINSKKSELVRTAAENLYAFLKSNNVEVLLDDRDERAGVLFADHDLIGIPHRVVIGEKNLQQELVEYKARNKEEVEMVSMQTIADFLMKLVVQKVL